MNKYRRNMFIWGCTLPALLLYSVFCLYPYMQSQVMAFYSWSGVSDVKQFIGLDNFRTLVQDRIVIIALKNNLILLCVVPVFTMFFSLFFAVLLTRHKLLEKNVYRALFFFPNMLAIVIASVLWSFVYHPTYGFLNKLLMMIGLERWTHVWLGEAGTVLGSLALPMIWQSIGFYMVIYIAAIGGIPASLFEAAILDGASEWNRFWHITLPLIWGIIRLTILFFIITVFNGSVVFVDIMTNGGPNHSSEVLLTYMYRQGFTNGNFGYSMAIGMLVLAISVSLAIVSKKITEREMIEY